jgi:hypothetical protein
LALSDLTGITWIGYLGPARFIFSSIIFSDQWGYHPTMLMDLFWPSHQAFLLVLASLSRRKVSKKLGLQELEQVQSPISSFSILCLFVIFNVFIDYPKRKNKCIYMHVCMCICNFLYMFFACKFDLYMQTIE